MAHYELLLFDADATLFDFKRSSMEAFRATMQKFEVEYTNALYGRYNDINQELWQQLEKKKMTSLQIRERRYEILFSEYGIEKRASLADAYYLEELGKRSYLLPGAEELIKALAGKHRMAIVTNGTQSVQYARLKSSPLAPYIEEMFISEEIGFSKPDTKFFDYVFSKLVPANRRRSLVIGDSLTADIKGGEDSGIPTCWYNPLGATNHTKAKPTYEISELKELLTIV